MIKFLVAFYGLGLLNCWSVNCSIHSREVAMGILFP
uniref:Uncharacterized protein n=1 Tax=Rhizophora mucronata TaxID=61149 RepID=A0A2P2PSN5_RHIMU